MLISHGEDNGDIITKVGIDHPDSIGFQIMKHRWNQEKNAGGLYTETGMAILPERTSVHSDPVVGNTPVAKRYTLPDRPMEGDLIWFPMVNKLFVIAFVEHEKSFYPLGAQMTYILSCNLFDYSSERINTDGFVSNVDSIETTLSTDILDTMYALVDHDGSPIVDHNGEPILTKGITVDQIIAYSNNELIHNEAQEDMIFDELNPLLIDQRTY